MPSLVKPMLELAEDNEGEDRTARRYQWRHGRGTRAHARAEQDEGWVRTVTDMVVQLKAHPLAGEVGR